MKFSSFSVIRKDLMNILVQRTVELCININYQHDVIELSDGAVVYAQDGYKITLMLEDLLGEDVMLADMLDDQPLSIEHGVPLRLVMPEHYGYKNLKHLARIEF